MAAFHNHLPYDFIAVQASSQLQGCVCQLTQLSLRSSVQSGFFWFGLVSLFLTPEESWIFLVPWAYTGVQMWTYCWNLKTKEFLMRCVLYLTPVPHTHTVYTHPTKKRGIFMKSWHQLQGSQSGFYGREVTYTDSVSTPCYNTWPNFFLRILLTNLLLNQIQYVFQH